MTVCGTGGWTGPLPGDPDNNVILTAQFTFGGINVRWTYPGLNPQAVSYTIVYRNTVANFATAYQHAIVGGSYLFDPIEVVAATEYFYWIRIMSVNGTLGDTIGPASAIAAPTVSSIIDMLSGQIDQSMLAGFLSTQISQIELNRLGLTAELLARDAADDSLGASLTIIEAHSDTTRALLQEEVLARTTNDSAIVSSVNTLWAEHDANVAAVQVETNARVAADSALANQITTAQTTLNGNIASVQTTLSAEIALVDGEVTNIGARWTAVVDVNGLVGGFGIYNNGTVVDAGFNVDNFWIGKVGVGGAPGVYPFIVTGGQVYMKSAMISQLTADQIDTRGLTIKDALGNVIFGSGTGLDWSRINGSGKPANNATVGADWNTNITNIPYDEIVANDDAVTLGLNPSFEAWSGTYPDGWSREAGTGTPVKDTVNIRHGQYAMRMTASGADYYMVSPFPSWASNPLATGTFVAGSVDMLLTARTSGLPGILVRLFTNAGLTTYVDTKVQPPGTVINTWQRVPFTARVGAGERIYGIRVYCMASYSGFPAGFIGTVVFDAIKLAFYDTSVDNKSITLTGSSGTISITGAGGGSATGVLMPGNPLTSVNMSTYVQALAVGTLQLGNNVVSLPQFAESGEVTLAAGYTQLCYIDVLIPATGNSGVDNDIPVMIQWHAECNAQNDGADPRHFKITKVAFTVESLVHETFSGGRDIDEYSGGVYRTTILAGYNVQFRLYAKGSGILYHSGISVTVLRR